MQLEDFLNENFPHFTLRPPLFYRWDIGIRFELGSEWVNKYNDQNYRYVQGCYERAIALFEALHSPMEHIFVVIDVNDFQNGKNLKRQLNNFPRYVKNSLLYRIKHQQLPYIFPEDDEKGIFKTHRFTLLCRTSDFKYVSLLKAVCNQELGLQPSISHRVYFINIDRKTIFHVYDDRGCDVIARSPAGIKEIYEKYNDWILDYDRREIDKVFN